MRYGDVVELALYHRDHGFYATGGHAGRRGDFLTSPEVGPLFGHVVANAIDAEWDRLGRPDTFAVVDWGAGPGTLLRSILRAEPRCRGALRPIAVERSAAQRALHADEVESVAELGAIEDLPDAGLIIANELLDNLAFTPVTIVAGDVFPARVDHRVVDDQLVEVFDDRNVDLSVAMFSPGSERAVWQPEAAAWLRAAFTMFGRGRIVCIDYARTVSEAVDIRTYAEHGAAGSPLAELGTKDVTVDLDLEQLQLAVKAAEEVSSQEEWLVRHGIGELVEEGKGIWQATAAAGTLESLIARSRIRESEALLEPSGLGGFTVAEWVIR